MVLLPMQIPSRFPFLLLFIISAFPVSFCQKNVTLYQMCSTPFRCGEKFQNITYPFWGKNRSPECGEVGLTCVDDDHVTMEINGRTFRVLDINSKKYTLTIASNGLWNGVCPDGYGDGSIFDGYPFHHMAAGELKHKVFKLYSDCAGRENEYQGGQISCRSSTGGNARIVYFFNNSGCAESAFISVPGLESEVDKFNRSRDVSKSLWDLLYKGFSVEYTLFNWTACIGCTATKGLCWSGTNLTEPTCLCSDGSHDSPICPLSDQRKGKGPNVTLKVVIGVAASVGTAVLAAVIGYLLFFVYKRRLKRRTNSSSTLLSGDAYSSYSSSALDPEKCISNFGVHIFDYYELEEATNNFDSERELGDGGFGTVYKGKLKDGRDVAVKRLYENNFKRVDHFKNEVIILTRLRHKNLVTLYGCTSRHSRELLLVYEYVANGTVADHLHGALAKPGSLPWSTRMKIAVETASALCYLHASDVIHRDVKTNNILLDNNFCVKVADFGLSRLFPIHMTHISTAPQGTPGYVDPEYHQCYQLTDRSDVFSFGVVLIELITSMPAVDITRHRHEINLSNLAINKIQSKTLHEIVDPNIGFETDETIRLMVLDVAELAFQSLQQGRDMRPSMQEVLETLKHIQAKDGSSRNVSESDNQADEAKLLEAQNVTFSPNSVIEGWTSSTTTPNISN